MMQMCSTNTYTALTHLCNTYGRSSQLKKRMLLIQFIMLQSRSADGSSVFLLSSVDQCTNHSQPAVKINSLSSFHTYQETYTDRQIQEKPESNTSGLYISGLRKRWNCFKVSNYAEN